MTVYTLEGCREGLVGALPSTHDTSASCATWWLGGHNPNTLRDTRGQQDRLRDVPAHDVGP